MCIRSMPRIVPVLLICALSGTLAGQAAESAADSTFYHTLYRSLLVQVENHFLLNPPDSLLLLIRDDARSLAAEGAYNDAHDLLTLLIESDESLLPEVAANGSGALWLDGAGPPSEAIAAHSGLRQGWLQVETGIDYSQQEFEITLIESDSTLAEELRSPYLSAAHNMPYELGANSGELLQQLRLDGQFFQYELGSSLDMLSGSVLHRLNLEASYYHQREEADTDFTDSRFSYRAGSAAGPANRWYVDVNGRYKRYLGNSLSSSDIFSAAMEIYYENFLDISNSLAFSWQPSVYNEFDPTGYRYLQSRAAAIFHYWADYRRFMDARLDFISQQFDTRIGIETRRNSFISFEPYLEAEWSLHKRFGAKLEMAGARRLYKLSDSINPDYDDVEVQIVPKLYWGISNGIGAGVYYQRRDHRVDEPEGVDFAQQSDYHTRGLVASFEYSRFNGFLLGMEYRLSWRTYPSAGNTLLNAFYSDRRIHSINLLGWIPLTDHWQITLFANYDNDRDEGYDQNHSRHTIVNAGLSYRF